MPLFITLTVVVAEKAALKTVWEKPMKGLDTVGTSDFNAL